MSSRVHVRVRSPLSIADEVFTTLGAGPSPLCLELPSQLCRTPDDTAPGDSDSDPAASTAARDTSVGGTWMFPRFQAPQPHLTSRRARSARSTPSGAVEGRPVVGRPEWVAVAVTEVRELLRRPTTSVAVKNEVWSRLVALSQRHGNEWTVAAVGVALPPLVRLAASLAEGDPDHPGHRSPRRGHSPSGGNGQRGQHGGHHGGEHGGGHRAPSPGGHGVMSRVGQSGGGSGGFRVDLDAEILTGFLTELAALDPATTNTFPRLMRAARRAGVAWLRHQRGSDTPVGDQYCSKPPPRPWGHPDLVLVDAVTAGVITTSEAQLIGVTRLDGIAVPQLAARSGVAAQTLYKRRRRAEHRLADWLSGRHTDTEHAQDPTATHAITPTTEGVSGERADRPSRPTATPADDGAVRRSGAGSGGATARRSPGTGCPGQRSGSPSYPRASSGPRTASTHPNPSSSSGSSGIAASGPTGGPARRPDTKAA